VRRLALPLSLAVTAAYLTFFGLALSSSCANSTGFIITGTALVSVDDGVLLAKERYVAGLADGSISVEKVKAFNAFLVKYNAVWPQAVRIYQAAEVANDAAMMGQASVILTSIVAEAAPICALVGVVIDLANPPKHDGGA
jgi:hypothetical protein